MELKRQTSPAAVGSVAVFGSAGTTAARTETTNGQMRNLTNSLRSDTPGRYIEGGPDDA